MIPFQRLTIAEQHDIVRACSYLFSPEQAKNTRFITGLEPDIVKDAFRQKAKQYHPDVHRFESDFMRKQRNDRFIHLRESFDLLSRLTGAIPAPSETPRVKPEHPPKKIIAVGGAKGGIGKSVFAVNLGVSLSKRRKKTMLMDLDLGGANLHLYMGETRIPTPINSFISHDESMLAPLAVQSKYGPALIGGNSSKLGAANISFSDKVRLIKAIKNLSSDFIIMDLGGDTSYNVIDLFLAADTGFVLTTCDPASYLDAYSFIKVSVYRRLLRLGGQESAPVPDALKGKIIHQTIFNALSPEGMSPVKRISELADRIKDIDSMSYYAFQHLLEKMTFHLVINRVTESCDTIAVIDKIHEVAQKQLSVSVVCKGILPFCPSVEQSARELVPEIIKSPNGSFDQSLNQLIKNTGLGD